MCHGTSFISRIKIVCQWIINQFLYYIYGKYENLGKNTGYFAYRIEKLALIDIPQYYLGDFLYTDQESC